MEPQDIVTRLLSSQEPRTLVVDGRETTLTPDRCAPQPSDPSRQISLDGTWKVARWPFDAEPQQLAGLDTEDATWEEVTQPGKVFYQDPELCPSDIEGWNRVNLSHIDPEDGAVLRKAVTIPAAWKGKRIRLYFGAVYPGCRVYVNGRLVAEHLSGLTPLEADVTDLLSPGDEALIAVRLLRRYDGVSLDMPRHALEFAGLAQSARLFAVEPVHLSDLHVRPVLSPSARSGTLKICARLASSAEKFVEGKLAAAIFAPDGQDAGRLTKPFGIDPGQSVEVSVAMELGEVLTWSAERPNLYRVELAVDAPGQDVQSCAIRAGFRRLEFKDERPLLNGRPVKFRGVNFLTFHPNHGMHTPAGWLRENLELMKRANVNCIRTHFLSDPTLADLCDEMGFYLMQELPFDWAAEQLDKVEYLGPILQRVEGGIRRDRNHPSVVVWSLGNENLPPFRETKDTFWLSWRTIESLAKTLAPDTATMFPPPGPANKIDGLLETRIGDIADTHYTFKYVRQLRETGELTQPESWEGPLTTRSRDKLLADGWSGVWFSSEWGLMNTMPDLLNAPYLSLLGDWQEDILSGRNSLQVFLDRFGEEWGLMRDDPHCLGGAFFPWMCSGSGDPWGWMLWGEDADWGVVTHDLLPKPYFWALRVQYAPVVLPGQVIIKPGDESIRITVRSLYNEFDLSECVFRTMMGRGGKFMGNLRRWRDVEVACPPGESVETALPLWNDQTRQDLEAHLPCVCRCIVLEPSGYRAITHDILLIPESLAGASGNDVPVGPDANIANL